MIGPPPEIASPGTVPICVAIAAVCARLRHQVNPVAAVWSRPPTMPTHGLSLMIAAHAGERLGVRRAVAPHQHVHGARVLLAQREQLLFEQIHQHRQLALGVLGGALAVGVYDGDAVDLQLGVSERQTDVMFAPGVVRPLDVGRGEEPDGVVVGVALDDVVAGAVAVGSDDRERDVALAAGESLLAALEEVQKRLVLDRLVELTAFVEVVVE